MSPEQVAGDPREIDVRADVYALGVLLFQLLTGDLPIDVRNCSVPEAARKIRDESPLRAGSINRTLRGEIETIVAKALDKDRARRYQSAAELAADIRRYLHGEPIDAKRDSALYVMRKTLSRHRAAFAVAALFLTVLMVFGVVSFMQARNNRFLAEQETIAKLNAVAARNLAQEQRERADRELRISNIERGRLFGYTHNLAAAEAMLWREHLREPDLHTYWALWELYSREPLLARWTAHPDVIRTTRFSPDGALIASAGDGGVIRLWDTATRTQVAQLRGHRRPIRALAFSPHGRLLASAGVDGAIRLWNLATRDCDRILYSDARDVYALAFDRDGRRIAAGDISGELLIHNLDGPGAAVLRAGGRIEHVCFNDDGTMIAASGADGATHIWTYPDLEPRQTLRGHDGPVAFAAFSPDGQTVASGGWDRMVRLWDIASGECSAVLSTANGTIRMVHFTDNGRSLISSGWWSTDTWDIATRQRIRIMHAGMLGMNLTPDNRLVVGGQGTDLLLWDNDPDAGLIRLDGQSGRMTAAMSPDGSTVLTGDGAGAVRLWDARDGGVPREFSPHSDRVRCVQFNRDGTLTASGGSDGVLRVCEARSGAMLAEIAGYHDASADSMRFSPDGRRIAFSNARAGITLRDLDGGRSIDIPAVSAETINLCFSPDGELLASAARDGNVRIWSSADGAPRAALATDGTPWGVEFSPDGGRLAVGTWGFNVELWDVQSATRVGLLEGHRAVIWHVDWSPADPRLLASAADDGAVKLWDASQSRCLATFDDFAGQSALTVAFSPDGRYLLAAGGDGASVLRDLTHRDRHIEGNRVWHADRLRAESGAADAPGWPPVP
jgi:WD40 repeat protein